MRLFELAKDETVEDAELGFSGLSGLNGPIEGGGIWIGEGGWCDGLAGSRRSGVPLKPRRWVNGPGVGVLSHSSRS